MDWPWGKRKVRVQGDSKVFSLRICLSFQTVLQMVDYESIYEKTVAFPGENSGMGSWAPLEAASHLLVAR